MEERLPASEFCPGRLVQGVRGRARADLGRVVGLWQQYDDWMRGCTSEARDSFGDVREPRSWTVA